MEMKNPTWAKQTWEQISGKLYHVAERNQDKIPYTAKDGVFDDMTDVNPYWWTNGFWGGLMWQLYTATGETLYKDVACKNEEKLKKNLMSYHGMDHDSGFKWLLTAVANYRITGNEQSMDRGLIAANSLAGRFNPTGRFIRAWNDGGDGQNAGVVIIDAMMNLPLLYWASEVTKDPRFAQIAMVHADTAGREFVRADGSVHHIVTFDPQTGKRLKALGGQGYEEGSSWTRGQAWALYGFCLSYRYTGKQEYLDTARKVADYFVENIPESNLIPVDFRQPKVPAWEDDSAAAIAASGLLEIADCLPLEEGQSYRAAAEKLLKALADHRCNSDPQADHLLERCTAAYHDENHEYPIIYGDYYFVEGILKLTGQGRFLW